MNIFVVNDCIFRLFLDYIQLKREAFKETKTFHRSHPDRQEGALIYSSVAIIMSARKGCLEQQEKEPSPHYPPSQVTNPP